MRTGAIGQTTDYCAASGNVSNDKAYVSIAEQMDKASVKQQEISSKSGILGLTVIGNTGYAARYADTSTPEKPIIRVGDYEVNIHEVDPTNATELEIFALVSYMEDAGMIERRGISSFSKVKAYAASIESDEVRGGLYDENTFLTKKRNWTEILRAAGENFANIPETYPQAVECRKIAAHFEKWNSDTGSREKLREAIANYVDSHKLTGKELKEEKDWRELSEDEWDKLLENIDEYIESVQEYLKRMKKLQDEAAQKAAADADPDMRANAASAAALNTAANGREAVSAAALNAETDGREAASAAEGKNAADETGYEKNWTKKLDTEDQTILNIARIAQDMENTAISKWQEVQLTGSTQAGISRTGDMTEYAYAEEDEDQEKVWTVTVFTEQGIVSNKCKNGKIIDHWEITYENPHDAEKVWDFIEESTGDADLKVFGTQEFWEAFLNDNIEDDRIKMGR